jgi:hypothetical protein
MGVMIVFNARGYDGTWGYVNIHYVFVIRDMYSFKIELSILLLTFVEMW